MIRHVLVSVLFDLTLPIPKDSPLDVRLLRAAHTALLRQRDGITDAFLFIVCTEKRLEEVSETITRYGFPEVHIATLITQDADGEIYYDEQLEFIESEVSRWLDKFHSAALTVIYTGDYDSLEWWWTGCEAVEDDFCWPFDKESIATCLPDTHRKKAATWLAILKVALTLDEPCDWVAENRRSLYAAALCEWLHGFEAASGNWSNHFEPSLVATKLNFDNFYLGALFGQQNHCDALEDLCEDSSISDVAEAAIAEATKEERQTIRGALSKFFGSDTGLYWALHTAIWPTFKEPSSEAFSNHMGLFDVDYGDIAEPWQFVTDGWSEGADN